MSTPVGSPCPTPVLFNHAALPRLPAGLLLGTLLSPFPRPVHRRGALHVTCPAPVCATPPEPLCGLTDYLLLLLLFLLLFLLLLLLLLLPRRTRSPFRRLSSLSPDRSSASSLSLSLSLSLSSYIRASLFFRLFTFLSMSFFLSLISSHLPSPPFIARIVVNCSYICSSQFTALSFSLYLRSIAAPCIFFHPPLSWWELIIASWNKVLPPLVLTHQLGKPPRFRRGTYRDPPNFSASLCCATSGSISRQGCGDSDKE